jgi:hypothetical protein
MTMIAALFNAAPKWALAIVIGVLSAALGWTVVKLSIATYGLRSSRLEVASLRLNIEKGKAEATAKTAELQAAVTKAQNDAKQREADLLLASDAAHNELDGMRSDISTMRAKLANATRDAAVERAASIGHVLQECAAAHQELARRCDGHVNDIRTMRDAWPK